MKQTYKIGVSKSYENPNFSKIKDQIMRQAPIQMQNVFSAPKQFKPPTPQPQTKKQVIKIENQRPISQGTIKPPLNSTSNRLSQKLPVSKPEKPIDLKKSIKPAANQNVKEITFGKNGGEDFGKQAFGMSFNKFNNGILLQSMRLSKEEIDKNNDFLNKDMKEMDEEDDFDDDYQVKKQVVQIQKKPVLQPKSNIENKKPLTPTYQPTYNSSIVNKNRPTYSPIPTKSKVISQPSSSYNNSNISQKQGTLKRPLSGKPLNSQASQIPSKSIIKSSSSQLQKTAKFKQF